MSIKKHTKKVVLISILIFPFFNEKYLSLLKIPSFFVSLYKIIPTLFLFYLFYKKNKKPSNLFCILLAMEFWWLVVTIINNPMGKYEVYKNAIKYILFSLSFPIIVEYYIDDFSSLINAFMINLEIAIYPNLILLFLSNQQNKELFLGYYTTMVLWIIPAICVAFLQIQNNKEYLRGIMLIISSVLTALTIWCATIVVSLFSLFAVFVFETSFLKLTKEKRIGASLLFLLCISFVINIVIVIFYQNNGIPILNYVITNILKKSITFTERNVIWAEAIKMIEKNPILGYGYFPTIEVANSFGSSFNHSHNQILQRMIESGIIGLGIFVAFHIELANKIDKVNNNCIKCFLVALMFSISITYITEAYKRFYMFYSVFFIAYQICENRCLFPKKQN